MHTDKRKHIRSALSLETIYFTEGISPDNAEQMYYPGTIIDSSDYGLRLRVNYPHSLNDKIWFDGLTTTDHPRPATVRWVNSNDRDEYLMGLEFSQEGSARQ